MATLPTFFRRTEAPANPVMAARPVGARMERDSERDPHMLRALPNDDILFYCKKIDNSRLVREADPQGRGACWSAIGGALVLVALLTSAFFPTVATTLAGYKLEALRTEERQLLAERRNLELQEAELLSPARLDRLAKDNNLVTPSSRQVVHLDAKGDATVAMVK
jgi:cell division protein FtsL